MAEQTGIVDPVELVHAGPPHAHLPRESKRHPVASRNALILAVHSRPGTADVLAKLWPDEPAGGARAVVVVHVSVGAGEVRALCIDTSLIALRTAFCRAALQDFHLQVPLARGEQAGAEEDYHGDEHRAHHAPPGLNQEFPGHLGAGPPAHDLAYDVSSQCTSRADNEKIEDLIDARQTRVEEARRTHCPARQAHRRKGEGQQPPVQVERHWVLPSGSGAGAVRAATLDESGSRLLFGGHLRIRWANIDVQDIDEE
mmetsp:Transcript_76567/g.224751  ORF Transcript_76567/g.224751 Transcript_76567/m.224751 type:complete len:256 (+) Transcript_76567:514-1281(+)